VRLATPRRATTASAASSSLSRTIVSIRFISPHHTVRTVGCQAVRTVFSWQGGGRAHDGEMARRGDMTGLCHRLDHRRVRGTLQQSASLCTQPAIDVERRSESDHEIVIEAGRRDCEFGYVRLPDDLHLPLPAIARPRSVLPGRRTILRKNTVSLNWLPPSTSGSGTRKAGGDRLKIKPGAKADEQILFLCQPGRNKWSSILRSSDSGTGTLGSRH
jgi:hypothetical protein